MIDPVKLIGREEGLFRPDFAALESSIAGAVREGSFLIVGAAGSVGQAVTMEICRRDPRRLHLIDISENNLVELIRDIRSSIGYTSGDLQALPLDCGSPEFDAFVAAQEPYDYIVNLSALKHVRSEKDPFSLMRMVQVNILNAVGLLETASRRGCRKCFAVSTDKACRPVNMMGASKSIMELFLMEAGERIPVSSARFANVLFSDGSLPFGFMQRIEKRQPISAPRDVQRYIITPRESGELCLAAVVVGGNREIFFPKLDSGIRLIGFPEIACRYLEALGYEPHPCGSEEEARGRAAELISKGKWPCWFFDSDTTGEKEAEEFYSDEDVLDLDRFQSIGVIRSRRRCDPAILEDFLRSIRTMRSSGLWDKARIVEMFGRVEERFQHKETHRYLDGRM